jgi:dihydrofolate reductase
MKTIGVFNHVTLDGFYAGPKGEIDWFKVIGKDAEWEQHTRKEAQGGSTLLMGRTTYEMMKSFWPTPAGIAADKHMATVMNESPKVVVSRSLTRVAEEPNWKNVTLWGELSPEKVRKLKEESSGGITILGSGSVIQQLANMGLIDEYELAVVPVVLGAGKQLFKDVRTTEMKLVEARSFKNGLVLLRYRGAQQ